jgi:FKBP-type peptidyl-prolyl cis-trans isomerase (trigger factor)
MMEMAREMGQPPEAIANFYNQGNMLDNLRHSLLQEKTLNFLVENAKITDAAISAEDLKEADGGEAEDNA